MQPRLLKRAPPSVTTLLAALALVACSGKVRDEGTAPSNGGAANGSGGTSSAGVANGSGSTSSTGGTSSFEAGQTCAALSSEAAAIVDEATASAHAGCATDDDCVYGPTVPCIPSCGGPMIVKSALSRVQAAVDATASLCAQITRQGCPMGALPCIGLIGGPACVNGTCENFIPEKWAALSFVESTRYQSECSAGGDCRQWVVTPDGRVATTSDGDAGASRVLSASALKAVTTFMESVSFRQEFEVGFSCGAPDVAEFMTMTRKDLDGQEFTQDVSGCIFGAAPSNDALTLWNVVQGG